MNTHRQLRSHTRAPLHVEVSLESDHNFWTGLTNDISEGGLFVATYDPPRVGEVIDVELDLPGAGHHKVEGVVRWVRDAVIASDGNPPGCGVQWLTIAPEALEAIAAFVAHRDTIFYEAA